MELSDYEDVLKYIDTLLMLEPFPNKPNIRDMMKALVVILQTITSWSSKWFDYINVVVSPKEYT